MSYANITIEINGVEIGATVEYDYTPEVPANLFGHPDNCHEGESEEWEVTSVNVFDTSIGLSDLLEIKEFLETIIESIRESWDD